MLVADPEPYLSCSDSDCCSCVWSDACACCLVFQRTFRTATPRRRAVQVIFLTRTTSIHVAEHFVVSCVLFLSLAHCRCGRLFQQYRTFVYKFAVHVLTCFGIWQARETGAFPDKRAAMKSSTRRSAIACFLRVQVVSCSGSN